VVEVELALKCFDLLLWGEDPVEAVLAEDGHLPLVVVDLVLAQQLHDLAAHRRLVTRGEQKNRWHGKTPAGKNLDGQTDAQKSPKTKRLPFTPHSDNACGRAGGSVSGYFCGGNQGRLPGSHTHKQLSAEPNLVHLTTCEINLRD